MSMTGLTGLVRAQTTWQRSTGLSEDHQTNTMYFGSTTLVTHEIVDAIDGPLATWIQAVDNFLDSNMFISPALIDYYDMSEPEPRVPYRVDEVALTFPSSTTSLPLEVTMCVSYEAMPTSGENQARRRGRVYLPTFINTAVTEFANRVGWTSTAVTTISNALDALATACEAADAPLCVFSLTTFKETPGLTFPRLAAATTQTRRGWIDNEPDTQRRRGTSGSKTLVTFGV